MKRKQFKFFAHTNNNVINPDFDDHNKFDNGFSDVEKYDLDIIIIDLKNSDEKFEGCDILAKIWEFNFRPTYSEGKIFKSE